MAALFLGGSLNRAKEAQALPVLAGSSFLMVSLLGAHATSRAQLVKTN